MSGKETLKLAMAEALLEKVIEKTESGKSRTGSRFRKYSKAYAETDEFKAAGKSRGDVNLSLSGDMLGLVGVVNESANTVTLGWEDSDEAAKAHGHITGGGAGGKLPVRDFFGLNNTDIDEVKREFRSEINEIKNRRGSQREQAILSFIRRLEGDDGS